MASLILAFIACWLAILRARDTATGRALRRLLVEAPADRLSRITRADMASGIVLAVGIGMLAFVGETNEARKIMLAMPDIAIWITTFELSSVVEIVMAVSIAVSSLHPRAIARRVLSRVRRPRRIRRPRPSAAAPANDDERHPAIARAA